MEIRNTPSPASTAPVSAWTSAQLLLFRFSVAWFLLYIFFNPNGILPGVDETFNFYITPFHRLIPWIGQHMLTPVQTDNGLYERLRRYDI